MLFLKNDSCIYCTTIKVETPYSGKRKCLPENQTGGGNQYRIFLIFAQKAVAVHEFNKAKDDFGISFHNVRFCEICSRCSKNG